MTKRAAAFLLVASIGLGSIGCAGAETFDTDDPAVPPEVEEEQFDAQLGVASFAGDIVSLRDFAVDNAYVLRWKESEYRSITIDGYSDDWAAMLLVESWGDGLESLPVGEPYALGYDRGMNIIGCSGPDGSYEDETTGVEVVVHSIQEVGGGPKIHFTVAFPGPQYVSASVGYRAP